MNTNQHLQVKASIKSLELRLAQLYKQDSAKRVFTPFDLGDEILAKLPLISGEILVISDAALVCSVVRRLKNDKATGKITFITDDEDQGLFVSKFCTSQKIPFEVMIVDYNKNSKLESFKKLMKQIFDIIVGNPPYSGSLHWQILEIAVKHLAKDGHLLFVHPATQFAHLGLGQVPRSFNNIFSKLVSIEMMNANAIWQIGLQVPLAITYLSTKANTCKPKLTINGETAEIDSHSDLNIHTFIRGFSQFKNSIVGLKSIKDKILIANENGYKNDDIDNMFFIEGSVVIGNVDKTSKSLYTMRKPDGYALAVKSNRGVIHRRELHATRGKFCIGFKTEAEAKSCWSYFKTKFARACLDIHRYKVNIDPWLFDTVPQVPLDRTWTDEMLCKHFKLSDEAVHFLESIPDLEYDN